MLNYQRVLRIVIGKQGKQRIFSSKLGILFILSSLILIWMFCQEASGMNQKQWSNPSCGVMIQAVCPVGNQGDR